MSIRIPLYALAVALLASACVSAEATMLGGGPAAAPVPEQQVRVFLADEPVPEACQRYALISLSGSAEMTSEAQMISAARRRAGKIGANAVQLAATREPGTGRMVAAAIFGVSANRKSQVVAYRCGEATS